jgi:hypothetical protein
MRRIAMALGICLFILLAVYTAWWYVLGTRLQDGLESWAAARRAEGWSVSYSGRRLGGWPTTARVVVTDFALRGGAPELPIAIDWHAEVLDLELSPFDPSRLALVPRGPELIGLAGGPPVEVSARTLKAIVPVAQPRSPPWPIDLVGSSLRLSGSAKAAPAIVSRLSVHATLAPQASSGTAALGTIVSADGIDLPRGRSWPLGEHMDFAAAQIAISGPVPPRDNPMSRARTWRNAGGDVTLTNGVLRWGPLDGRASGHATLDANLQPSAEAVARVTGYAQALDVLAAHQVLSDHAALAAKAVLSLVAESPPEGGAPVLDVPFAVHDGILSVHGIPVAHLPQLRWEAANSR